VESVYEEAGVPMGKLNFGGVSKEVCLAYVPEIRVGQYAVVHVGFAISIVDEAAAAQTLRELEQLAESDEFTEQARPEP
jgi:hydrogenase expression/formation protein HypC